MSTRTVAIDGEKLRECRYRRRWTQDKLARESGLSKRRIEEIERQRRANVYLRTLTDLCDALLVAEEAILSADEPDAGLQGEVSIDQRTVKTVPVKTVPVKSLAVRGSTGTTWRSRKPCNYSKELLFAAAASSGAVSLQCPISVERSGVVISGRITTEQVSSGSNNWVLRLDFPADACSGNSASVLSEYDSQRICVEFDQNSSRHRVPIRLDLDDSSQVLRGRTIVTLPQVLSGGTRFEAYDIRSIADTASETLVSFPLVGGGLPAHSTDDELRKYVSDLTRGRNPSECVPPDWLYHLSVSKANSFSVSDVASMRDDQLQQMAERLFLTDNAVEGFYLQPRELTQALTNGSDFAFPMPTSFVGKSFHLAVAVGMVAAYLGRKVPTWLTLSAGLDARTLQLTRTGSIGRKIRLTIAEQCVGLRTLIERMYETDPDTAHFLHAKQNRAMPGDVKLLITSADLDVPVHSLKGYSITQLPADQFTSMEMLDFDKQPDSTVVIQMPNLHSVLRFLGLQDCPLMSTPEAELERTVPVGAYLVERSHGDENRSVVFFRNPDFWSFVSRSQLSRLEDELETIDEPRDRLSVILNAAIRALRMCRSANEPLCHAADVEATGPDKKWVHVLATCGESVGAMPFWLPADFGVIGRVIRTGKTAVLSDAMLDPDLRLATRSNVSLSMMYGAEYVERYLKFVESIKCCVKIPLRRGGLVIGVMCIHWKDRKEFVSEEIELLEQFADRAAVEVAYLSGVESSCSHELNQEASEISHDVSTESTPDITLEQLALNLAKSAIEQTGAIRSAVRLITAPQELKSVAVAPGKDAWVQFDETTLLVEDCAGTHAIHTKCDYFIEDTRQTQIQSTDGNWSRVHYRRVKPEAGSHASVVISAGHRSIGVLSVDWEGVGGPNGWNKQVLRRLSQQYAIGLHRKLVSHYYENCIAATKSLLLDPIKAYSEILDNAAVMVGANQGAMFILDRATGRYEQRGSMHHAGQNEVADRSYERGQGVTGWILQRNRPLIISNLADPTELRRIDAEHPPQWADHIYDGKDKDDGNMSFIGVPLSAGDRVHGVIRFGNSDGFTTEDQMILELVASHVANVLHAEEVGACQRALRNLAQKAATSSLKLFAPSVEECLQETIGKCDVCIRFLDVADRPGAESVSVLTRVFASKGLPTELHRQLGNSLAGDVIRSARPCKIDNSSIDPRVSEIGLRHREHGSDLMKCKSIIVAPLMRPCQSVTKMQHDTRDDIWGTLFVSRDCKNAFDEDDVRKIQNIADLAGPIFSRILNERHEQVVTSLRNIVMDRIVDNARQVRSADTSDCFVRKMCSRIREYLGANAVGFWQKSEVGFGFCFSAGDGIDEGPAVSKFTLLLETGGKRTLLVADPAYDPRLRSFGGLVKDKARAVMIVGDSSQTPGAFLAVFGNLPDVSAKEVESLGKALHDLVPLIAIAID